MKCWFFFFFQKLIFWGPSGGGKTTLLNMLGTLDYPTSGTIGTMPPKIIFFFLGIFDENGYINIYLKSNFSHSATSKNFKGTSLQQTPPQHVLLWGGGVICQGIFPYWFGVPYAGAALCQGILHYWFRMIYSERRVWRDRLSWYFPLLIWDAMRGESISQCYLLL